MRQNVLINEVLVRSVVCYIWTESRELFPTVCSLDAKLKANRLQTGALFSFFCIWII